MVTPIVHIGYHKTASTWFQQCVYPQVRNLAYVERNRAKRAFLSASAFHFDPHSARAELALDSGKAPIVCEEELSGYLQNGGLLGYLSKEMARRVQQVFPNARIVIFVRAQPEMVTACYQQYLRAGGTHAPRRYLWPSDSLYGALATPYKAPRFSFDHFDYDLLVSHYMALFGRERVRAYAYEEVQRDARGFLERFAKELELEIDLGAVSVRKQNPSYSLVIARLVRVLNHFTERTVIDKRYWLHVPGWYATRRLLAESLNDSGWFGQRAGPEALLGERTIAWIRQRFWESNRRLAALVPWDLAAFGYPIDPPAVPVERPQRPRWLRWTVH